MSLVNVGDVRVEWNGALNTTGVNLVVGETPGGAVNGVNATYTTALAFVADSIACFVNGVQATKGIDYTTSGGNTLLFTYSPASGDIIRVNYKV